MRKSRPNVSWTLVHPQNLIQLPLGSSTSGKEKTLYKQGLCTHCEQPWSQGHKCSCPAAHKTITQNKQEDVNPSVNLLNINSQYNLCPQQQAAGTKGNLPHCCLQRGYPAAFKQEVARGQGKSVSFWDSNTPTDPSPSTPFFGGQVSTVTLTPSLQGCSST